ncbi:MAG: cytochrome c [Bryobacteraceae bacterium]|jgi:mono/diheme cytochrome c family protein
MPMRYNVAREGITGGEPHMQVAGIVVVLLSLSAAYAAGDAKEGKTVYDQHCQNCHGVTGVANPKLAKMMNVNIPNLGSSEVQRMSDDELKKIVTGGKGKMPPVRSVTGKSIDDVVAYIRTLKK